MGLVYLIPYAVFCNESDCINKESCDSTFQLVCPEALDLSEGDTSDMTFGNNARNKYQ